MQIESHLPQFTLESALFIVAGEKIAKFYGVHDGQINELERYSDRQEPKENFFQNGGVYKEPKRQVSEDFLTGLKTEVRQLCAEQHFAAIYLFAPIKLHKQIRKTLGRELEHLLHQTIDGNLVKSHPFGLLERIKEETQAREARRSFYSSEVKRLLTASDT